MKWCWTVFSRGGTPQHLEYRVLKRLPIHPSHDQISKARFRVIFGDEELDQRQEIETDAGV